MAPITKDTVRNMIKAQIDPLMTKIRNLELNRDEMLVKNCHLLAKIGLLERRIDDLDQYSKRQNLILDGVHMRKNETPDNIRNAVIAEIERLGLEIDDTEIDQAHRIEQPYKD